jgi:hypothetical protein
MPVKTLRPGLYETIAVLFSSSLMVYNISADAFLVILNLMKYDREADEARAFEGIEQVDRKQTEDELFGRNLIYRHEKRIGIFGGRMIVSEELV